ncbi:MAG: hypothetical protein IMF09_07860, partial [Proteobacteria bacterium]|nr:hypothetical protein [Pseudomonadota bacterium]
MLGLSPIINKTPVVEIKTGVYIAKFERYCEAYLKELFGLVMSSKYQLVDRLSEADIVLLDYDAEVNRKLINSAEGKSIILITEFPTKLMFSDHAIILSKPVNLIELNLGLRLIEDGNIDAKQVDTEQVDTEQVDTEQVDTEQVDTEQ